MTDDDITRKFSLHFGRDEGLWIVWTNNPILTWGTGRTAMDACNDFFSSLFEENRFMRESTLSGHLAAELIASDEMINGLTEDDFFLS